MAASYEVINYGLRPAKHVERKMIVEGLGLLGDLRPLRSFQYVGFGSVYFSDFRLIHKNLGIKHLVSIERDEEKKERFNFNKPYRCVVMQFGRSQQVLPTLDWTDPMILWLDYDGNLSSEVLSDIATFVAKATAPSAILVTVNAAWQPPPKDAKSASGDPELARLRKALGPDRVPANAGERKLVGWGFASLLHEVILNEIHSQLAARNGAEDLHRAALFRQLFHFNYRDGAKMLTVGGVLYGENQRSVVQAWPIAELPFLKEGSEPFLIEVPQLTYKEMRHLDQLLPSVESLELAGLSKKDVEKYALLYRYFPMFADADL